MYLSSSLCLSLLLSFLLGQVMVYNQSDQLSQSSKVSKLFGGVLSMYLSLSLSLSFCWSFHVFLSPCLKGQKFQRSLFEGIL